MFSEFIFVVGRKLVFRTAINRPMTQFPVVLEFAIFLPPESFVLPTVTVGTFQIFLEIFGVDLTAEAYARSEGLYVFFQRKNAKTCKSPNM